MMNIKKRLISAVSCMALVISLMAPTTVLANPATEDATIINKYSDPKSATVTFTANVTDPASAWTITVPDSCTVNVSNDWRNVEATATVEIEFSGYNMKNISTTFSQAVTLYNGSNFFTMGTGGPVSTHTFNDCVLGGCDAFHYTYKGSYFLVSGTYTGQTTYTFAEVD